MKKIYVVYSVRFHKNIEEPCKPVGYDTYEEALNNQIKHGDKCVIVQYDCNEDGFLINPVTM